MELWFMKVWFFHSKCPGFLQYNIPGGNEIAAYRSGDHHRMFAGAKRGYRFGYPGGAILNVYDALYRYSDKIKHVLTSHEQGASHAADGYARATGKVGVCLATSGPGATNLVTGIAPRVWTLFLW